MKALFNTKKVSIYCSILYKNKYYEASGTCSLSWEMRIEYNSNEVFGTYIDIPTQKTMADLYFIDENGNEVNETFEIQLNEPQISSKSINLKSALLPQSIEILGGGPIVYFSANPESPF